MIKALVVHEIKSGFPVWLIFAAIITLYGTVVVAMYEPKLGESLHMMAESMPELFAAFGMADPGLTLLDFISNYLYGFILIVIPFIYTVVMAQRLMGRYIDQGSLAYLLASPNSRIQIFVSQLMVLLGGIFCLILYTGLLIIGCARIMFDAALDISAFLRMNGGLFCLHAFFAAVCYGAACSVNDAKKSVSIGAGCAIAFLLVQMLSQISDKIADMKYLTPLTLFDVKGLMHGTTSSFIEAGVLLLLAVIIFGASAIWFKKRDLPL